MSTFRLPAEIVLTFDEDTTPHSVSEAHTMSAQAQWQRAYAFIDGGASDKLYIMFGFLTGSLTVTDLMLATDYAHSSVIDGFTGLWLPSMLTPVSGSALDTVNIGIYFDPLGATGTAMQTFACLQRPSRLTPQQVADGLVAAVVAYRWEIFDTLDPSVTPSSA